MDEKSKYSSFDLNQAALEASFDNGRRIRDKIREIIQKAIKGLSNASSKEDEEFFRDQAWKQKELENRVTGTMNRIANERIKDRNGLN